MTRMEMKEQAAIVALNEMLKNASFSICTLDSVAELLGVSCRGSEAYNILRTLHCINFAAMPIELRNEIPALIRQCLGRGPEFQFTSLEKEVITVSQGNGWEWARKLIAG